MKGRELRIAQSRAVKGSYKGLQGSDEDSLRAYEVSQWITRLNIVEKIT